MRSDERADTFRIYFMCDLTLESTTLLTAVKIP
jgi:hypothetical protein